MSPAEVLERLDDLRWEGVAEAFIVRTDDGPRVRVTGPAEVVQALAPAIAEHRALVLDALLGRCCTGHALAPCTVCQLPVMTAVLTTEGKDRAADEWPPCRLTPGCEGRHRPPDRALALMVGRIPPRPQKQPPASRSKQRKIEGEPQP